MPPAEPSDASPTLPRSMHGLDPAAALDEKHYGEVDVVLLYITEAARRAEKAADELRRGGAEDFLVEALERAREELAETQKLLTQRTFFAVPKAQLSF